MTLICVDTRTPALAVAAMQRSREQIDFHDAVLFTDPARLTSLPVGIRMVPIRIESVAAYSEFMLRGLLAHVRTDHVLVVQWDGYVTDASRWDPCFLQYDYIGALIRNVAPAHAVGNGGFSLRSRRLLQALQDPSIEVGHPEDICICRDNRPVLESRHGIRFAPARLAADFSFERVPSDGPTFGFHGLFNLHLFLPPDALQALLEALPDALARGLDAHDLCATMIRLNRLDAAAEILRKRKRLGMTDRRTLRLQWRFACARLLNRVRGGYRNAPRSL